MIYHEVKVIENKELAKDLFRLRFDYKMRGIQGPGQFAFIMIQGRGERAFSIFGNDPLAFLIANKGECTNALSKLQPGDSVLVRGPHGQVPQVSGKLLLVGGGTGVAGVYPFASFYRGVTCALLGAEDRAHLYDEPFHAHCGCVYPFTKSGEGYTSPGLVTSQMEEILSEVEPDFCLNCGPEPMIHECIRIQRGFGIPEMQILCSPEFHAACGVGICGKCATPKGLRSCVDGTWFTPMQLGL